MLGDLEGIFKDVFRDYCKPSGCLPQGSVILLGSLSHLCGKSPGTLAWAAAVPTSSTGQLELFWTHCLLDILAAILWNYMLLSAVQLSKVN